MKCCWNGQYSSHNNNLLKSKEGKISFFKCYWEVMPCNTDNLYCRIIRVKSILLKVSYSLFVYRILVYTYDCLLGKFKLQIVSNNTNELNAFTSLRTHGMKHMSVYNQVSARKFIYLQTN